ncbi:MAG: AAA-like domain-containing protein [bacterium]
MREFNTSGPCDPKLHYTVLREELLKVGQNMVEKGKYFTIWAPRQAGKTTYFKLLIEEINKGSEYFALWISFEGSRSISSKEKFYNSLKISIFDEINQKVIKNFIEEFALKDEKDLFYLFRDIYNNFKQKLVLVIDEVEGCPEAAISDLMHTFREMYHKKHLHALQSLILVGVSNISGIIMDYASPFNIADELTIPYFTEAEVADLINQYEVESKQGFSSKVKQKIFQDTAGQPGLVCGMCKDLVEKFCPDKTRSITLKDYWKCLDYYLREKIDKNISNIVSKAKKEKELMLKILFTEEVLYTIDDERMTYLLVNGVIARSREYIDIPVPLYKKRLITAFRPLFNGEGEYYPGIKEDFNRFYTKAGINIELLLDNYQAYIRKRGFRAFDVKNLKESAWHYSLDGYLYFFIERLGGKVLVEVPTGRGRVDILILYKNEEYVIETKRYTDNFYYQKGKRQLMEYLKNEGLSEGYYVVFSNVHEDEDILKEKEEIERKIINSYIIRTNIKSPTK